MIGYISDNLLIPILDFFYGLVPSYGLAIVALTVVIRLALFPLSAGSIRSARRMRIAHASSLVPGCHWSALVSARSTAACNRSSASAGLRASAWATRRNRGRCVSNSSSKRNGVLSGFGDETDGLARFIRHDGTKS